MNTVCEKENLEREGNMASRLYFEHTQHSKLNLPQESTLSNQQMQPRRLFFMVRAESVWN